MLPLLEVAPPQFLDALQAEFTNREIKSRRWKIPFWGEGIEVPFSDGYDHWIFPFLHSPQVVPFPSLRQESNPAFWADEFETVNASRSLVLRGLRFYLAGQGWATQEWGSRWSWQAGIMSGSLDVSKPLTRAVRHYPQPAEALRHFRKEQLGFVSPVLTLKEAQRCLDATGEPPRIPWKDDATEPGIGLALLAFDEKAMDAASEAGKSGELVVEAALGVRHELGFQAVQKLIPRLGESRFSFDLKGRVDFKFSDDYGDFQIFPRRRAWRRPATEAEVESLVGELEAKLQRLDAARARFLNGWLAWAQAQDFTVEKVRWKREWRAGATSHQFTLELDRVLNHQLHHKSPESVLCKWLSKSGREAPTNEQLTAWCNATNVQPREGNLDRLPGEYQRLLDWTEVDWGVIDDKANEILEAAKATMLAGKDPESERRQYPLEWWSELLRYQGPSDAWADDKFWLEVVRRHRSDYGMLWQALRGDGAIEQELRVAVTNPNVENYWWESFDDFVLLFFRSEVGFVVDDADGDASSLANIRPHPIFPLPPDISAARANRLRAQLDQFEAQPTEDNADSLLDTAASLDQASIANWLSESDLQRLKTAFTSLVQSQRFGYPDIHAREFWHSLVILNWPDLAALAEQSPKTQARLFAHDDSYWDSFLLGASIVRPSHFVAQLSASILTGRAFAPFSDQDAAKHGATQFRDTFKKHEQAAAAIAWKRCRAAGIGDRQGKDDRGQNLEGFPEKW